MKLLLFDLDGTLIRADGSGRRALDRAIRELFGAKPDARRYDLAGKTDLRNFAEAIAAATGRKATRAEVERVHREYLRRLPGFLRAAVRAGRYRFPRGVRRLLRALHREEGVLLGLGTGNMERGARIKLGPSGFNDYFKFGGFGSDAYSRPALLKTAYRRAKRLPEGRGLRPRDVYVIGDTPRDVEAGRRAGFRTVGVGTGFARWEDLARSRPDHLAKDYGDLELWLGWFGVRRGRRRRRRRDGGR